MCECMLLFSPSRSIPLLPATPSGETARSLMVWMRSSENCLIGPPVIKHTFRKTCEIGMPFLSTIPHRNFPDDNCKFITTNLETVRGNLPSFLTHFGRKVSSKILKADLPITVL